jgi:hypothetical protein
MKRPTPIAGPIRAATTIMTKGFAIITLYPAQNSKVHSTISRGSIGKCFGQFALSADSSAFLRKKRAAPDLRS